MNAVYTNLLLGIAIAGAAGGFAGWSIRKLGEASRRRAVEVYYREALKISEKARDRARAEAERLSERMLRLRGEHEEYGGRIESLQSKLGGMRRKETGTTARATELKTELQGLRSQLEERSSDISRLKAELKKQDAEIAANNGHGDVKRLETDLAALKQAHSVSRLEAEKLRERIREMNPSETEAAPAEVVGNGKPRWLLPSANGEQDDLKSIHGLGPVLERGLNGLGVFYYRQVARMTEEDVEWIAPRLNVFPGRILRDNWAAQARKLHFRKYRKRL